MNRKALFFAVTLVIAGMSTVAASLSRWSCDSPTAFLLCLALAVLGATFTAYFVSHSVAAFTSPMMFLDAAIVYHVSDTVAVSTVFPLLEDKPLRGVWHHCHLWSFSCITAGGAFAAVWAQTGVPASFAALTIGAMLLYPMATFYREIVARTCPVGA